MSSIWSLKKLELLIISGFPKAHRELPVASRHLLKLRSVAPAHTGEGADRIGQPQGTPYYGWVLCSVGDHDHHLLRDDPIPLGVLVVPWNATFHWGGRAFPGLFPGAHSRGIAGSAHRVSRGSTWRAPAHE